MDERVFYKTKTFWGAVGFAALIILNGAGVSLPYEQLVQVVVVWSGYSIAERFRK